MNASAAARRNRPIPAAAIEKLGEHMKKSACINIQADLRELAKSDNVGVIDRTGMIIAGECDRRGGVTF